MEARRDPASLLENKQCEEGAVNDEAGPNTCRILGNVDVEHRYPPLLLGEGELGALARVGVALGCLASRTWLKILWLKVGCFGSWVVA